MLDLTHVTADTVIAAYLDHEHRRSSIPSLSGIEPDMPASTAGPNGEWETLCLLLHGVDRFALAVLRVRRFGYAGVQWERTILRLDSGTEIPQSEQIAIPLLWRAVASWLRKAGVPATADSARKAADEAHLCVTLNLAEWRRRDAEHRDRIECWIRGK